jgi:hypothetical protein
MWLASLLLLLRRITRIVQSGLKGTTCSTCCVIIAAPAAAAGTAAKSQLRRWCDQQWELYKEESQVAYVYMGAAYCAEQHSYPQSTTADSSCHRVPLQQQSMQRRLLLPLLLLGCC